MAGHILEVDIRWWVVEGRAQVSRGITRGHDLCGSVGEDGQEFTDSSDITG